MSGGSNLRARFYAKRGRLELDIELDSAGDTLALVGPNGAGKTSLLAALLGIVPIERGRIQVGDQVLVDTETGTHVPLAARRLAYVPQDYALFPHLSVSDNVAFAMASSAVGRAPAPTAINAALERLGVAELADRFPQTLSGGEKQRVALARALSVDPRGLLLDEPLAALDVHTRRSVRNFLRETLGHLTIPTVIVTHDPADARVIATRIVVLEAGKITQQGSWSELATRPASPFVEEFVSSARD
ncbi:MAG TPA: ABC transporter ATP-binding protein [Polyangiaceae bacterium]|nr:ABC transporter ATP-binding protein [Polyangiaceae bacterium]